MTEERISGFSNYIFRHGGINQMQEIFLGIKPNDFILMAENERMISMGAVILLDSVVPRKSEMERMASILLKNVKLQQGTVQYCTRMNFSTNQENSERFCNMKYSDYINI